MNGTKTAYLILPNNRIVENNGIKPDCVHVLDLLCKYETRQAAANGQYTPTYPTMSILGMIVTAHAMIVTIEHIYDEVSLYSLSRVALETPMGH